MPGPESEGGRKGAFTTTQWSLVVAARDPRAPEAQDALALLCGAYWRPIYAYVRRRGADADRAGDLTQGFFAKLLEKNWVGDARRERGRFRTFLLTSLKHYLANEWDREQALKRGGGRSPLSLDGLDAAEAARLEPTETDTPETAYDRRWARSLLDLGLDRLREEVRRSGPTGEARFEHLLPFLSGEAEVGYREVAAELGISTSAAKVAAHRMRRRFRAILREEVARTVHVPELVDDELQHLFAVLGR